MRTRTAETRIAEAGIDAVALKPAEHDVDRGLNLPVDTLVFDYEGRSHLPGADTLEALSGGHDVRVTLPIRADGFDPLGDDSRLSRLPEGVRAVLVAGHSAYLTDAERRRAVAPRLRAAVDRYPDAWVGTEGIERVALTTGATQYELLSRSTERDLRGLRAAGFDGRIALYAPTVLTDDSDALLDAVGSYVARRGPVASALPDGAATDASATGRAREVLSAAIRDYALIGTPDEVGDRVAALKDAGADLVVGYPARGLSGLTE